MTAPSVYRPVPGPADRITFFEAQRRHRSASRRFSLAAACAVFLTGLPLSVVFTPFLYGLVVVGGYVAAAISPSPSGTWRTLREFPLYFLNLTGLSAAATHASTLTPRQSGILAVALILPGAVMLSFIWLGLRVVFRHAGVGGVLLTLGARDPRLDDLEERQLVNVVEEMAIAAGVPPPRVMLIDDQVAGGAANAAAVGWAVEHATIVVTRPLLDQLRRDETQAIIARLIGSVGNGDLKIALIILSLFQAVGLATLVLKAVFGGQSRRTLWRLLRLTLTPGAARGHAALESDVMTMLARGGDMDNDMDAYLTAHSRDSGCRSILQLPRLLGVAFPIFTSNFIVGISTAMFTGPLIGAMWKRRELLADATAVQLTRNPDGLAAALERLQSLPVRVPRADSVSHLFAVWGTGGGGLTPDQVAAYREAMRTAGEDGLSKLQSLAALSAANRANAEARGRESSTTGAGSRDSDGAGSSVVVMSQYMHAKVERRLAQLRTLGAHPDPSLRPDVTPAHALRTPGHRRLWWVYAIVLPLGVIVVGLLGVAFILLMTLDVVFMAIMLLMVWVASHLVFVVAPSWWHHMHGHTQ